MAATKRKVGGRSARIDIDLKLLAMLAERMCSMDEIAAMLRRSGLQVDTKTIKRRMAEPAYRQVWDDARLCGKATLRSNMWRQSQMNTSPGVNMAKFLATNYLGMSDRVPEINVSTSVTVEQTSARDRLGRKLDALSERIEGRVLELTAAAGATAVPRQPVR